MAIMFWLVSGLAISCIYALNALGFALICKGMEVVNFAQGDIVTVFPYSLYILATAAFMALFGMVVERAVPRPLTGEPVFIMFIWLESHLKKIIARLGHLVPGSARFHSEPPWNLGPEALGDPWEALTT